jgi:7,8-dihydro-6-hydroxymethylpterin dimethyltransferase
LSIDQVPSPPVASTKPHLADYLFRGTTQSLCPGCLKLVTAKIIVRQGRVYFRKRCEECGEREDFVCSDVEYYDRLEYAVPSKIPAGHGIDPKNGCPYDCGLCTEHEQHTCIALVELTSNCNLKCPMCFASSGPGGTHLSLDDIKSSIDRIVKMEGRAEVVQLSGGEPTIHPHLLEIIEYAFEQPIDYVQINSNGIRFAKDDKLIEQISKYRERLEVFFQFDGLEPAMTKTLRGEDILATKLAAIEKLGQANIHITLAVTLQAGVNESQYGAIVKFAAERPWITGINFQPATYSGRYYLPQEIDQRITFPDVIKGIAAQTEGMFRERDFIPLPCAHPNCHQIGLAYRSGGQVVPLTRFFDALDHLDLLANGISFTRENSRSIIAELMAKNSCCPDGQCGSESSLVQINGQTDSPLEKMAQRFSKLDEREQALASEFLERAVMDKLGAKDLLRITITSFLDAYNFDTRRLMKCCTHHVLPSGHVIPFCAYNVLYREGHVELPELAR